jgi:hypothetical protein
MTPNGKELQKQASSLNGLNSPGSSTDLRKWVATELQAVREMIPGPLLSDQATNLYLDRLEEVASTVGAERFHAIVLHIIDTCDRRPTVATFRKLAGLNGRLDPQQEQLVAAWDLVSKVLTRHVGRDHNGNVILRPFLQHETSGYREIPVPEIPQGVKDAVRMMGGWAALVESWPTYAGQKFSQFSQLYRGEPLTALVVK